MMETMMEANDDSHMAGTNSSNVKHKMGSTVLDSFTMLGNDKENERVDGAIVLLRHLFQSNSDETKSNELQYTLSRLVRGMGTSRVNARKGFFATLTAFLSISSTNEVTRILKLLELELHATGSSSKSEAADIYTGQILVCGALIHSKVLLTGTLDEQQRVLTILLTAGKKRSYLSYVSYSFIIDLINQLDENEFKTIVWPLLKPELAKPWNEQTLDTLQVLLVIDSKYPAITSTKFLKKYLGSEKIIDETSVQPIASLLMGLPMLLSLRNPVYKLFCERIASTEHVISFWTIIEQHLASPTRNKILVGLDLSTFIISNIQDHSVIPALLTPNFLQNLLKSMVVNKKKKNDEVVVKFKDLLQLLVTTLNHVDVQLKTQISALKKLLLYPGDLLIEKKTGTKVIQMIMTNLKIDGVKKVSKIFKEIAGASKPKQRGDSTEAWTNVERIYAAQLLTRLIGHPAVSGDFEWRLEQLKFLFQLGLCQSPTVGVDLAGSMKDSFYRALDLKLSKLNDLRTILSSLVHYIDSEIITAQKQELRTPLAEDAADIWTKVMSLIKKLENSPKIKQAVPIFHTMELQMALQLFSEPEMAISSIKDLHSCYERLERKKGAKIPVDEPEWVEVVIDLVLSLLSKGSHLLRSLVGCVFPHICPMLTASSIQQILDVLDPKNDKSPLSSAKDDDDDSESNVSGDETDENDDNDDADETEITEDDCESESESDSEDVEDDTVSDKLRMAVQQALGDAMVQTDDDEVDVDEITEEEGARLDNALANAFKVLRENRQSNKKKQGKDAQALTHFRVRVVDLLEIFLDTSPSMELILEILLPLFALLEFSIKDSHQKPLENRIRACLKKLSSVKKFSSTEGVTGEFLTDILKALIEKGSKSSSIYHEMGDKLAECCTFLVRCSQQLNISDNSIVDIYRENLITFFKKRDSVLPALLFKMILNLQWIGNWNLAPLLVEFAFDNTIRPFRRNQALEFLAIFYRNNRLLQANTNHAKIRTKLEKKLSAQSISLFADLEKKNNEASQRIKQKFVSLLLTLFYVMKHQHQSSDVCDWKSIGEAITRYRSNVTLSKDAKTAYNKLANELGLPAHTPNTNSQKNRVQPENGETGAQEEAEVVDDEPSSEEDSEVVNKQTKKEKKKKQKIKSKQNNKQLLKKESRELRMKAISNGLDSVNFSAVPMSYVNDVDMDIADTELTGNNRVSTEVIPIKGIRKSNPDITKTSPQKRLASESQNLPFKSSKKKK